MANVVNSTGATQRPRNAPEAAVVIAVMAWAVGPIMVSSLSVSLPTIVF